MGQDYRQETHVILTESQVDKLLIQSIDKYIQVSSVTELTDNRSIVSYLSILNQDESVKNVQCLLLRRQRKSCNVYPYPKSIVK